MFQSLEHHGTFAWTPGQFRPRYRPWQKPRNQVAPATNADAAYCARRSCRARVACSEGYRHADRRRPRWCTDSQAVEGRPTALARLGFCRRSSLLVSDVLGLWSLPFKQLPGYRARRLSGAYGESAGQQPTTAPSRSVFWKLLEREAPQPQNATPRRPES